MKHNYVTCTRYIRSTPCPPPTTPIWIDWMEFKSKDERNNLADFILKAEFKN